MEGADGRRNRTEAALSANMSPPFVVLPGTVRFPYPVVAHNDYGMVAVLTREGLVIPNEASGTWDGMSGSYDPDEMVLDAVMELCSVARAPADRLTGVVWFPGGKGASNDIVCVSPEGADLARAVENAMRRRLVGSSEPVAPWIGAYAASALVMEDEPPEGMKRTVAIVEHVLGAATGDAPIVCYGLTFSPFDLADPRYFLPALIASAFEDWGLVVGGRVTGNKVIGRSSRPDKSRKGFSVTLEPDVSALLGYRVARITPSAVYTVLATLVAALRRCEFQGEFSIEEMIQQFARFLHKNGLDATVVEDANMRLLASEGAGDGA